MISMQIIAGAGDAKGLIFDALEEAKKGNFEQAKEFVKQSEEASKNAHKAQMDLLVAQANGDIGAVDVLLVHAQDHLMTTLLAQELIKEIIRLYELREEDKK
ncbi:MAG: PTS lactose/cellobiose transporter subunit IIA [Erysipelotrichaceae bacterium]|nr:PTS lactose/cellobiose transporter subunit IIA [Erysipelotrichaceae bacterium]MBQ7888811.1 PTS lactose/cellobiose transporter subunit IIA [Erysipelotrichaceae bacterium]